MDSEAERALRVMIMHEMTRRVAETPILTRADLTSFEVNGTSLRLVDRGRGIWNPAAFEATLTIISDPESEYDDGDVGGGRYRYSYQKGPDGGINTKLRRSIDLKTPIIMFRKVGSGFVPVFPVYVIEDDAANRQFILALDESLRFLPPPEDQTQDERRYAERIAKQRLHQPVFRARVLRAYETQCAVCVLRKGLLLDAAHITGDADDDGLPLVSNGLCLCKIHHAAYDAHFLGISPDHVVHINAALLEETDGPMLKHGIQEMDNRTIVIPHQAAERPDPDRLSARFEVFKSAS